MNMSEMGQVFAYLLKYRYIESKKGNRRNHRPGESDLATVLQSCDPDAFASFKEFLKGQGMQLREYRDTDFKGIPSGGRVWLMMRSPMDTVAPYLGIDRLHMLMALRENESRTTTGTWFLHIWLMYLALVYTRLGRGVSQVSVYQDAVFTKVQLIETVSAHIETVRQIGVDKGADEAVFAILDSAKGLDVDRRVKAFIELMLSAGLIMRISEDAYQQTLLGAAEFDDSYGRTMRHYLNIEEDAMNSLANISNILTAGGSKGTDEEGVNVTD